MTNKTDHINDLTGKPYDTPETIDMPTWVKNGIMLVRRDALDWDNPEHSYNYAKRVLNVRPENYGYEHPLKHEFGDKSREELIDEILQLRNDVIGYETHGNGR